MVLRVVALSLLLLLALFGAITVRTLQRIPDLTVYFVRPEGTAFALEAVHVHAGRLAPADRAARQVAALVDGPPAGSGLVSEVPPGTELLSASLDGPVLTVDLNAAFEDGAGTATLLGRLNQLLYTLTQPGDVGSVRLLIEGSEVTRFGSDGVMIESPWVRRKAGRLPSW